MIRFPITKRRRSKFFHRENLTFVDWKARRVIGRACSMCKSIIRFVRVRAEVLSVHSAYRHYADFPGEYECVRFVSRRECRMKGARQTRFSFFSRGKSFNVDVSMLSPIHLSRCDPPNWIAKMNFDGVSKLRYSR